MSRELIDPNLHAAMIHAPLGLLMVGTVIELLAPVFWRRSTFRTAGRWMILLGALTILPTATAGAYAMADLNGRGNDMLASWADIRAKSPIQGHAWEMMRDHARINLAATIALMFLMVIWLSASDRFRRGFHLIFLVLLLADVAAIGLGAWHGGEMVYHHGVGVNLEAESSETSKSPTEKHKSLLDRIEPVELHVILAGAALAAGLAAIGVALRASGAASPKNYLEQQQQYTDIGYAINPASRPPNPAYGGAAQLHPIDAPPPTEPVVPGPVSRFWVLAALLAIAAMLAGWWTLADGSGTTDPKGLWQLVKQDADAHEFRRLAHVASGGAIVVLMLLLALIGRAAGKRIVVGLFSLLLLLVILAQGWLGVLLLLDTASGPLQRYNPPKSAITTTMPSISHEATTRPSIAPPTAPSTAPATKRATTKSVI